jgi:succinate dehydrogenase / fumarate reductase membrane anchor subunit
MTYGSRPAPQNGLNFEYLMWMFTRISGLAMCLLALVGIIGAFLMGARTQIDMGALLRWTFFPNPFHVVNTEIPDVTLGWATAYWQIMEMMLVFFGVTHGVNGLRMVIEDYLESPRTRTLVRSLLFLFWLFLMIVCVYVILFS